MVVNIVGLILALSLIFFINKRKLCNKRECKSKEVVTIEQRKEYVIALYKKIFNKKDCDFNTILETLENKGWYISIIPSFYLDAVLWEWQLLIYDINGYELMSDDSSGLYSLEEYTEKEISLIDALAFTLEKYYLINSKINNQVFIKYKETTGLCFNSYMDLIKYVQSQYSRAVLEVCDSFTVHYMISGRYDVKSHWIDYIDNTLLKINEVIIENYGQG